MRLRAVTRLCALRCTDWVTADFFSSLKADDSGRLFVNTYNEVRHMLSTPRRGDDPPDLSVVPPSCTLCFAPNGNAACACCVS